MEHSLYKKYIISIHNFNRNQLELILKISDFLKNTKSDILKIKLLQLFFEPLTQTRLSFEAVIHRLGASLIGFTNNKRYLFK